MQNSLWVMYTAPSDTAATFKCKWIKMEENLKSSSLVATAILHVSYSHTWLVASGLDRADIEPLHHWNFLLGGAGTDG